ncbi:putative HNH endonuclease [Myxococcus phage Mx9]|nr:putative HNH endonuclease [Myxococcus phage Mx9]
MSMPPARRRPNDPMARFWSFVEKSEECWVWKGALQERYGVFSLPGNRTVRAHRFSYIAHHGPIPSNRVVCHRCDNPPCVNPEHLFLGSRAENMADKMAKGRFWAPRLTAESVRLIRKAYEQEGANVESIAHRFGVSTKTAKDVATRRTWKHVG